MLSQDDRRRLNEIERQLLLEDPAFVARMSSAPRRRIPRVLLLISCVISALTVVLAVGGWWVAALALTVLTVIIWLTVAYVAAT